MNKKIPLGAAIAYMAIVAAITFSLTQIYAINSFNNMMENITERESTYSKLSEIDLFVRENYYGDIDSDAMLSRTAIGYVEGLGDPDSRYMSAQEYEEYTLVETGRYVGIGVVTELSEDGYIRLKTVYPDSPAEYVGLKSGDIIISVDGTPARAESYLELSNSLRGEAGTRVTLVRRDDNAETSLEITRREVDIPTVTSSMVEDVGYLTFTDITQTTATHMERAIRQLTDSGATSLIIDMRGMNSQRMEYIVDMLDILMPDGDTVLLKYKTGEPTVLATSDAKCITLPITVLADENTSGACEMFVLAIREQPNCLAVGVTTAGKGSMQEAFKLKDGSALLLTTAVYSSARGQTYNETGVTPDYEVKLNNVTDEEKAQLLGNPEADLQLRRAVEMCQSNVAAMQAVSATQSPTPEN